MIISLNLGGDCNPLPPILVKLTGSDEVILIELQGSIATTGDTAGQLVGTLSIDPANNVCIFFFTSNFLDYICVLLGNRRPYPICYGRRRILFLSSSCLKYSWSWAKAFKLPRNRSFGLVITCSRALSKPWQSHVPS